MRRIVPILLCAFVLVMAENAWVGPAMPGNATNNPTIPKLAKPRAQATPKILTKATDAQVPVTVTGFSVSPGKASPLTSRERVLEPTDNPDETLHFDVQLYGGIGITGGGTFWSGVRFTPTVGCTLKAIQFYQYSATTANGYVYVFDQGSNTAPGAVLDSMAYTGAGGNQWKRINLTTPRVMASGRDFWIGVKTTHATGEWPLGYDGTPPGVSQRSLFVTINRTTWSDLASTFGAWNLQAVVASLPYGDDMAAMSIDELTSPKTPNQWLTLKTTVKNVGTNSRAPGVRAILRITGPSYSYSDTALTTTTLAPNGTEQLVYSPNWRTPATVGFYTLTVFTDLSGDQNQGNDTTRYTLEVSNWLTYADWNNMYWYTWAGPEKGVVFDPTEFGVAYPIRIDSLKTYFYAGFAWRDSSYRYKIYGGDLTTLLYTSPWLEANTGSGIYKYALPSPVTINSGIYLVTVDVFAPSDSYPTVLGDNVHRYRSVYGDSTAWYNWDSGELFVSSFVNWTAVANDVGMVGVRAPWLYTEPNVPMSPIGVLKNFGTAAQTAVPCSVFVYDTTNALIYSGGGTANVNAGDTARVTFSPQWTPPNVNDVYYEHMATFLASDQNRGNDSAYHEFFGFRVSDPLVAPWDSAPVTVDGNIQTAEWAAANKYDISNILGYSDPYYRYFPNNCFAWFKHDSAHLYVAVEIPMLTANDSTEVGLYLDDNNDGAWAADSSEGNYWAEHLPPTPGDTIEYRALTPTQAWRTTATGSVSKASITSGHMEFEIKIPFGTAKAALNVNPMRDTLGFWTYVLDDNYYNWVGWWKTTMDDATWRNPSTYGKLILTGRRGGGEVGVTQIVRPPDFVYGDSSFTPEAKWKNNGAEEATFDAYFFIHNKANVRVYSQLQAGLTLAPGEEKAFDFITFNVGNDTGMWYARCSTAISDTISANNTLNKPFRVGYATPPPPGWKQAADMPLTQSGKMAKDGAWLAYDAGKGVIFGAKGNKTADFYGFDPNSAGWAAKTAIPPGTEGKPVSKGGAGCSDGNGKLYASKGNSTFGFYEYNAQTDSWRQLKDVPVGVSGKKIKGGAGLAWGTKTGVGAAYLLKGYKNEFYKYNPTDSSWTTLTPAPVGAKEKYDKGSWLVSNGTSLLYAFKAKYGELYSYDCEADSWSSAKAPIPQTGSAGSKKAKDGSAGAWLDGQIYAFKGGTNEFWRYSPNGDSWREQSPIPLVGLSGRKKKVKAGGALAAFPPQMALYGLKGGKTAEFWRYGLGTLMAPAGREGVMAGSFDVRNAAFAIAPNPLATGFAALRYNLPQPGPVKLSVFDVAGRTVKLQHLVLGRSGSVSLDLRSLSAGVYLVKLEAGGFTARQKLVVQR